MKIIKRPVFSLLEKQLNKDIHLILVGPRQVGKTVFLRYLQNNFLPNKYPDSTVFYFNLEDESLLLHFTDYQSLLKYLKLRGFDDKQKTFLLLDEFQKMNQPTKILKLLYDNHPHLKIIATGSSSIDIFQKFRDESMSGRKLVFKMLPLNFSEFLRFQDEQQDDRKEIIFKNLLPENNKLVRNALQSDLNSSFQEFLLYGGYPRLALCSSQEDKKLFLKEIYNSYVQRDIRGILKLDNTASYTKLVSLLSSQIGNLLSKNEISNTLQINLDDLEKYLTVLEKTFIIKLVRPFFANKRKEITKMPKVYFLDTGLRNWILQNFTELDLRQDAGALTENFVFSEFYKNLPTAWRIFFWRTRQKTETDFILQQNEKLFPVEVKYKSFQKPIVPSGLKAFINNYQSQIGSAFVLTKDFTAQTKFNGISVQFLPVPLASKIFSLISDLN